MDKKDDAYYEKLGFENKAEYKKMISKAKSIWKQSIKKIIYTDEIEPGYEAEAVFGDVELAKMVQQKLKLELQIQNRIQKILKEVRMENWRNNKYDGSF